MQLPVLIAYILFGMVISRIDHQSHRIPNRLILGLLVTVYASILVGANRITELDWVDLIALPCVWFMAMACVSALSRGGFGMGDAKYIAVISIGACLFKTSTVLIVWIAALTAVAHAALMRIFSRLEKRTHIPFGPYLTIGALACFTFALSG